MKPDPIFIPRSKAWYDPLCKFVTCMATMTNLLFLIDTEETVVDGVTFYPGQCIVPVEDALNMTGVTPKDVIRDLKYLHKMNYISYYKQNGKHIVSVKNWRMYVYGDEADKK